MRVNASDCWDLRGTVASGSICWVCGQVLSHLRSFLVSRVVCQQQLVVSGCVSVMMVTEAWKWEQTQQCAGCGGDNKIGAHCCRTDMRKS
jgi:hypothetical protein